MQFVFETIMLICFGLSWPVNAVKAYRAGTAKGVSPAFLCLIIAGYIAGVIAKFISGQINYVLIMYFINIAMVAINLCIYFRNRALDKQREAQQAA